MFYCSQNRLNIHLHLVVAFVGGLFQKLYTLLLQQQQEEENGLQVLFLTINFLFVFFQSLFPHNSNFVCPFQVSFLTINLCLSLFQTVPHCMLNSVYCPIHGQAALDLDVVCTNKKTAQIFFQNPSSISSQVL
jgi:hypothetical protein